MKKFIYVLLAVLLVPSYLSAQGSSYELGTTIRINKSDTVSNNVISAGQFIDIFGHLNDDLFSASRNLTINGSVDDDAIVAARSVTVRGRIGDMLMAAGETIVIDGHIEGDLFAAGNEVRIAPNAKIDGNVALAGNEIFFEGGNINGWLRIAGNEITLNGTVNNYIELYGNEFRFGDQFLPLSATNITTSREITREELENAPEDLNIIIEKPEQEAWGAALLFSIWFYVSMLIIGIILIYLFKETTTDIFRYSTEHYFRNTGIGFLLFLGIPISILILFILVLTIPLSVMIMMLYGLGLFVSFLLVALTLGTRSIRFIKNEESFSDYVWGLALGMILIGVLTALPYAGPFINLILIFFGLGTLLSYFWNLRSNAI